ncbi:hypothetical protein SLS56_008304 [Neofusicoccum ribis]|uniref:Uncharacterized protein n=1 Tax=Neofusicoccum ribis TaxID=45134 RepID=A0ABR3SKK9_9PEZI
MLPAFRCSRPCEIRERDIDDGFNAEQERKLRKKERTSATHTEQDKWTEIYQTLFPNEQRVPSPYFYPPELDEYQQYCLEESGRILQQKLNDAPEDPFLGLGCHIQPQLLNLVHEIQTQLFEDFQVRGQDEDHGSARSLTSSSRSATPMTPFSFNEETPDLADDASERPSKRKRTKTPTLEQPFSNLGIGREAWSQDPAMPQDESPNMPPRIMVSPPQGSLPVGYGVFPNNRGHPGPGLGGSDATFSGFGAIGTASSQPHGVPPNSFDFMGGGYDPENLNYVNLSRWCGS